MKIFHYKIQEKTLCGFIQLHKLNITYDVENVNCGRCLHSIFAKSTIYGYTKQGVIALMNKHIRLREKFFRERL